MVSARFLCPAKDLKLYSIRTVSFLAVTILLYVLVDTIGQAFHGSSRKLQVGKRSPTSTSDILFTVTTSQKFYNNRLKLQLDTWIPLVANQTYVVTDMHRSGFTKVLADDRFVPTECGTTHGQSHLCCKMEYELRKMSQHLATFRWFCHIEDDEYVNIQGLVMLLKKYDWEEPLFIGNRQTERRRDRTIAYAVGNAGICLSKILLRKIRGQFSKNAFIKFCHDENLNADAAISAIVSLYGGTGIESVREMISHANVAREIASIPLRSIATTNYREINGNVPTTQVILRNAAFSRKQDPTRFISLHCRLLPEADVCSHYKRPKIEARTKTKNVKQNKKAAGSFRLYIRRGHKQT